MKTLLLKKSLALVCLLLVEFCSSEEFKIIRDKSNLVDSFLFLPLSKCDTSNNDYCAQYNATKVKDRSCFCDCDKKHATFSFHDNSWSCLKNEDARRLFGCKSPTFFEGEKREDKLSVLDNGSKNKTSLNMYSANCAIDIATSWYVDCGRKVPLNRVLNSESIEETFELDQDYNVFEVVDLPTNSPMRGKIVNLGISCGSSTAHEKYCLLFKVFGKTTCPLTTPTTGKVVEKVETNPPVEAVTAPTPAADRKRNDISPVSLGLIVGVTVAVILIILLAGLLIHRQQNARKHPRTISEGQSSQSDSESQPRTLSDGYATLSTHRSSIYASNYDVPNFGPEDNTVHLRPPYAVRSVEGQRNTGLDEEEPFYNTVDELFPNGRAPNGEYTDPVTSERPCNFGPFSVEQRVYNMIEDLNIGTSESPRDHGTIKQQQEHDPLIVEQRMYNMIENLNTSTSESPPDYGVSVKQKDPMSVEQPEHNLTEALDAEPDVESANSGTAQKDFPVYNVLEEALPNGTRDSTKSGSNTAKDPVYNVLEEPDPDKTDVRMNNIIKEGQRLDKNSSK